MLISRKFHPRHFGIFVTARRMMTFHRHLWQAKRKRKVEGTGSLGGTGGAIAGFHYSVVN